MLESEMYKARRAPGREFHLDIASYSFFFSMYFAQRSWIALRSIRIGALIAIVIVVITSYADAQELPPLAHGIVGSEFEYTVKPGDSLLSIGARKGIERKTLAQTNGIGIHSQLKPGQVLRIDNRHIVPADLESGILINLPQRKLFLVRSGQAEGNYPIGPGKARFASPIGEFSVIQMRENPTWYVPQSIQDEWARAGKVVKRTVPPGPGNPLGGYWIGMSFSSYGIHGTNKPLSIYDFQSRGCIRMHPEDAGALFRQVKVGDPGEIIYEPVLLAKLDDGRVYLEVHRDPYEKKNADPLQFVREMAAADKLDGSIDWKKAEDVTVRSEGIAREIDATSH